jgi:hypothetical protein
MHPDETRTERACPGRVAQRATFALAAICAVLLWRRRSAAPLTGNVR